MYSENPFLYENMVKELDCIFGKLGLWAAKFNVKILSKILENLKPIKIKVVQITFFFY